MDSQWQEEVQIIKALQNKYLWVILDFFFLLSLFTFLHISDSAATQPP